MKTEPELTLISTIRSVTDVLVALFNGLPQEMLGEAEVDLLDQVYSPEVWRRVVSEYQRGRVMEWTGSLTCC
jgi:hypothetical protein